MSRHRQYCIIHGIEPSLNGDKYDDTYPAERNSGEIFLLAHSAIGMSMVRHVPSSPTDDCLQPESTQAHLTII